MAGFASVDALNTATDPGAAGNSQFQCINVVGQFGALTNPNVGKALNLFLLGTSYPGGSPALPTTGVANGAVCTNTTVGAFPYRNPISGRNVYLSRLGAQAYFNSSTANNPMDGTLILADRIAHVAINVATVANAGAQTITGLTATSRLGATEGALLFVGNSAVATLSAAQSTMTFVYTNQAGTGSRTTPSIVTDASAPVYQSVNSSIWQPLQAGDSGVRSVQSITLTGTSVTGTLQIVLMRPLARIAITALGTLFEADFAVQLPRLKQVFDSSCLQFLWVPGPSYLTTNMPTLASIIYTAEG